MIALTALRLFVLAGALALLESCSACVLMAWLVIRKLRRRFSHLNQGPTIPKSVRVM
jgi:hypothetical protein